MTANATELAYSKAEEGARKVLSACLQLEEGDTFALFYDETTQGAAELLIKAADELGLVKRLRCVPLAEQAAFPSKGALSVEDLDTLEDARGIITLLSSYTAGTEYRKRLLQEGTNGGRRLGHMPGADQAVFAHSLNIDYHEALSRGDDLAVAMTLGEQARLRTYEFDKHGAVAKAHDLTFGLGGLKRSPISSSGIIPLGTWGNLPGGETFIAPMEESAEGVFVLNGAFKQFVFQRPDRLLLHFANGRLTSVEGDGVAREKFEALLDFGRNREDANWSCLAELGVGVNPGISALTGNALFDEKCYGTAHIAIGDSTRYGGIYDSNIHEDLVSWRPSLWIDDHPILNRGHFAFESSVWRRNIAEFAPPPELFAEPVRVSRSQIPVSTAADQTLRVRRNVTAGRVCEYTVGNDDDSRTLARVYERIPAPPSRTSRLSLSNETGFAQAIIDSSLTVLLQHGLISLRP